MHCIQVRAPHVGTGEQRRISTTLSWTICSLHHRPRLYGHGAPRLFPVEACTRSPAAGEHPGQEHTVSSNSEQHLARGCSSTRQQQHVASQLVNACLQQQQQQQHPALALLPLHLLVHKWQVAADRQENAQQRLQGWFGQVAITAMVTMALALSLCLASPTASLPAVAMQPQFVERQQPQHRQQQFPQVPVAQVVFPAQQQQQQLFSVSSQMEDGMLEALRQFEARLDRAFGAVSSSIHTADAAQARSEQAAADASAQALIKEVWEVVDISYMDARNSGFDHAKWAKLRDQALAKTYYDQASVYRAVRNMLAQGVSDPYCRFIPPDEFASMKKYDVTGVGLNLGTAEEFTKKTGRELPRPLAGNGGVWVVGLSKGSEADRAGIEQGDELLKVSGAELSGVTPFQAATLIAGPDDSSSSVPVSLAVRKANGQLQDVTVQRPARYLPSPVSSLLQQRPDGRQVGFIRLTSFNARALRDVSAALDELQQKGATELVLDLRDNRGGLVSEGLEVARLFLSDRVPIVLTRSKAMAADPPKAGETASTRLPLTVLVNEHTASASEILAGALKDNCRGLLVGTRTYGKGLIQSVYELSDSSGLVITVGKYLTPRGVDIDRFGIAPDFSSQPAPTQAAEALNACRLSAGLQQAGASAVS